MVGIYRKKKLYFLVQRLTELMNIENQVAISYPCDYICLNISLFAGLFPLSLETFNNTFGIGFVKELDRSPRFFLWSSSEKYHIKKWLCIFLVLPFFMSLQYSLIIQFVQSYPSLGFYNCFLIGFLFSGFCTFVKNKNKNTKIYKSFFTKQTG